MNLSQFSNFIATCLSNMVGLSKKDTMMYSSYNLCSYKGDIRNIHEYILKRAIMEKTEFEAYLEEKSRWWWEYYYYSKEDKSFLDLFTKDMMLEILEIQKDFADSTIDIETKAARIISFFTSHLICESPFQTFLIFINILSSKYFYVDRKWTSKKLSRKIRKINVVRYINERNLKYQTFFFQSMVNFIISNQSIIPQIQKLRENDERMFGAISSGFTVLSSLFLRNNFLTPYVPVQIQQKISESSCNLMYAVERNDVLWYQMIHKNFHLIENMDQKFRVCLIRRSHLQMLLISRLFQLSESNKLKKISRSLCTKLMLTRRFFPKFFPQNHRISQFLS